MTCSDLRRTSVYRRCAAGVLRWDVPRVGLKPTSSNAVTHYNVYTADDTVGTNRTMLADHLDIHVTELQIPMGTRVEGIRYFLVYTANEHGEQEQVDHALLIDDWTPSPEEPERLRRGAVFGELAFYNPACIRRAPRTVPLAPRRPQALRRRVAGCCPPPPRRQFAVPCGCVPSQETAATRNTSATAVGTTMVLQLTTIAYRETMLIQHFERVLRTPPDERTKRDLKPLAKFVHWSLSQRLGEKLRAALHKLDIHLCYEMVQVAATCLAPTATLF